MNLMLNNAVNESEMNCRHELRGTGVKLGQVYPGGIDTPWFQDPARGGSRSTPLDTSKFLSADDVAEVLASVSGRWGALTQSVFTLAGYLHDHDAAAKLKHPAACGGVQFAVRDRRQ